MLQVAIRYFRLFEVILNQEQLENLTNKIQNKISKLKTLALE